MKFYIILKRNLITIASTLFLIFLILFTNSNLISVKDGLMLWATTVVPSIFPFFIATNLLSYTNISIILGKFLNPIMRPIFNVPGESSFALIMGFISGYPIGAKIVSDLYKNKICTKDESERLLCFTNNSGPLFIIGTVGIAMLNNRKIGFLLFIIHIISALIVGFILRLLTPKKENNLTYNKHFNFQKNAEISSLGDILGSSIISSIKSVLTIGGYIVFFSVIISILNSLNVTYTFCNLISALKIPAEFSKSFFCGMLEITTGLSIASNMHLKDITYQIALCSFLLGFGGLSVYLQVANIALKQGLSCKIYFMGKITQGLISYLLTIIFLKTFVFLAPAFPYNNYSLVLLINIILAFLVLFFLIKKLKRNFIHNTKTKKYNIY